MLLTAKTVRLISTAALMLLAFSEALPPEVLTILPAKYHHWFAIAIAAANAWVSVLAINRHPVTGKKIKPEVSSEVPPPATPEQ